jgi:hypothetical protein
MRLPPRVPRCHAAASSVLGMHGCLVVPWRALSGFCRPAHWLSYLCNSSEMIEAVEWQRSSRRSLRPNSRRGLRATSQQRGFAQPSKQPGSADANPLSQRLRISRSRRVRNPWTSSQLIAGGRGLVSVLDHARAPTSSQADDASDLHRVRLDHSQRSTLPTPSAPTSRSTPPATPRPGASRRSNLLAVRQARDTHRPAHPSSRHPPSTRRTTHTLKRQSRTRKLQSPSRDGGRGRLEDPHHQRIPR